MAYSLGENGKNKIREAVHQHLNRFSNKVPKYRAVVEELVKKLRTGRDTMKHLGSTKIPLATGVTGKRGVGEHVPLDKVVERHQHQNMWLDRVSVRTTGKRGKRQAQKQSGGAGFAQQHLNGERGWNKAKRTSRENEGPHRKK